MANINENRQKALDEALKKIERNFGKGSVMKLGEKVDTKISTVPSGSLALDVALGVGGYPRGRIIEVYGPESSGKTTVALHAIAEVQKKGGVAAFIDAEHALDPKYAAALGVDIDELLLSQPDTGEQGLEIADALVSSGAVDIVVIDSVAALVPRAEIEGEMGDSHMGLQARLMSQALRKLSGSINTKQKRSPSSSTKSVRRSASCSAIRKRHREEERLSFTLPSVLKSEERNRSRAEQTSWVTAQKSK